jgi:hypothetical protein
MMLPVFLAQVAGSHEISSGEDTRLQLVMPLVGACRRRAESTGAAPLADTSARMLGSRTTAPSSPAPTGALSLNNYGLFEWANQLASPKFQSKSKSTVNKQKIYTKKNKQLSVSISFQFNMRFHLRPSESCPPCCCFFFFLMSQ